METKEQEIINFAYPIQDHVGNIILDIIDACNLACRTCPRGIRQMPNSRKVMDYDLFTKIIDRISLYGSKIVCLYNWTEPFLCKEIEKYLKYIKNKGLYTQLSSNLSFPHWKHIIPSLKYCDRLIVSVSGFTQEIYKINHYGGNVNKVKRNLEMIADAIQKKKISTDVEIRFFMFDYSAHEYPLFEAFASKLHLRIIPFKGKGFPRAISRKVKNKFPMSDKTLCNKSWLNNGLMCAKMLTLIPIDCDGKVSLCCSVPPEESYIGDMLSLDYEKMQYMRYVHYKCTMCRQPAPVQPLPHHKMAIIRGLAKTLDCDGNFFRELAAEADLVELLKEKYVYFWGSGRMFQRKRYLFKDCKPKCILTETPENIAEIDGIPVKHPDEVLPYGETLPVIIFAGAEAQQIIQQKIRDRYPNIKHCYCVSSL